MPREEQGYQEVLGWYLCERQGCHRRGVRSSLYLLGKAVLERVGVILFVLCYGIGQLQTSQVLDRKLHKFISLYCLGCYVVGEVLLWYQHCL